MQVAEIASIVQAVSGVYCAIIGTVAWLSPRHPKGGQQYAATRSSVRGVRLAALVGVLVLVLSLTAPSLYRLLTVWQATGALLLVMMLSAGIILRQRSKAMENPTGSTFPKDGVALATKTTFDSLSVSQRFLIKYIYHHPNTSAPFLTNALTELGFPARVGLESLNRVLVTNLVKNDGHGNVDPNPSIKNIVERLLETEPWPPLEILTSINTETASAIAADCRVGHEAAVAKLNGEHSAELAKCHEQLENIRQIAEVSRRNGLEDREEAVKWKQQTATLEQDLNGRLQDQAEHRKIQGEIWTLKQTARDLRRRGAHPLFLARPFDRLLWLDQMHPDAKWREDAVKWHETIRQAEFAKGPLQEILPALDFDELMEELDEYERTKIGLGASWMPANLAEEPLVLMMAQFEEVERRYGAWLCNYGSTSAQKVKVLPFRIGRVLFTFDEVQLIPSGNQKEFTQSTARETNGTRWTDLNIESALAFSPDCAPQVLTFFVEYVNSRGHRLRSRHLGRVMNDGKLSVLAKETRQY
jgi:hypothetical protein